MASLRWSFALLVAWLIAAAAPAEEAPIKYPANAPRRSGGRLPRHQGRRPVPLARRRRPQVGRGRASGSRPRTRSPSPTSKRFPSARPSRSASPSCGTTRSYSAPFKVGGRYFFTQERWPAKPVRALRASTRSTASRACCSIPNKWSKDGTVALGGLDVSDDGKYLAYGVAEAGSDWQTWKVLDVATGKPLADELKWVKFSGASWTPDGKGFFYSRFTSRRRARSSRASTSTRSSTITASARRRPTTCWSTSGPTIPTGASHGERRARTAAI